MGNKLKKSDSKGFTIIEVMIVLAIAGLILLIVLLAIPALQRNSRNTQIKNDASNVIGAISTFTTDNDGVIPDSMTATSGTVTIKKGTTNTSTAKIQGGTSVNAAVSSVPTSVVPGTLTPYFKHACDDTGGTVSARSVSIYYSIETTSGQLVKCVNT